LQQVKSRDKKVRYACAANLSFFLFFFGFKVKCLQLKLSLVAKSIFECQGVLSDITLKRESNSLCSDKLQRAVPSALCKQKFLGSIFLPSVFTCVRSRGPVIGISTRVRGGRPGVPGPDRSRKFFSSPKFPDLL